MQFTAMMSHRIARPQCAAVSQLQHWHDRTARVLAYAKNDHLGFEISYLWNGVRRRYLPDFLVRLANGRTLVLEIKGEDSEQNRAKRAALSDWVAAVNAQGGFGLWCRDVAFQPAQMQDILERHVV